MTSLICLQFVLAEAQDGALEDYILGYIWALASIASQKTTPKGIHRHANHLVVFSVWSLRHSRLLMPLAPTTIRRGCVRRCGHHIRNKAGMRKQTSR